jgi:hypothetical protein
MLPNFNTLRRRVRVRTPIKVSCELSVHCSVCYIIVNESHSWMGQNGRKSERAVQTAGSSLSFRECTSWSPLWIYGAIKCSVHRRFWEGHGPGWNYNYDRTFIQVEKSTCDQAFEIRIIIIVSYIPPGPVYLFLVSKESNSYAGLEFVFLNIWVKRTAGTPPPPHFGPFFNTWQTINTNFFSCLHFLLYLFLSLSFCFYLSPFLLCCNFNIFRLVRNFHQRQGLVVLLRVFFFIFYYYFFIFLERRRKTLNSKAANISRI